MVVVVMVVGGGGDGVVVKVVTMMMTTATQSSLCDSQRLARWASVWTTLCTRTTTPTTLWK